MSRFSSKQEISPIRDQKQIIIDRINIGDTLSQSPPSNAKSFKINRNMFSPDKKYHFNKFIIDK